MNNISAVDPQRFESSIVELLPHRPPMLLVNELVSVSENAASAITVVDSMASFYEEGKGVPAYIGLEYMGQTAALIAGYQLKHDLVAPHLGFLLGTRSYKSEVDYFPDNKRLLITCTEKAVVGNDLATFDCTICYENESAILASASLSVFRRPK